MKRLTEYSVVGGRKVGDLKVGVYEQNAFHKLARYEDTGLMPDEVEAMKVAMMGKSVSEVKEFCGIPIEQMVEIAEAYRGGRCAVLPFKIGQSVTYKPNFSGHYLNTPTNGTVCGFEMDSEGDWFVWVHLDGARVTSRMAFGVERDVGRVLFPVGEDAEAAIGGERDA